ncbi:MAG: hypothetical protein KAW12_27895 [Candidatus Aminicenantes bacterium]|nr:hypothetical protein [Candidatus Aminicenantes bacterium]
MYFFGKCGRQSKDPKIVVSEKKSKFTAVNKNKRTVLKVEVDDCLKISGKRCDWLLIVVDNAEAHFIELKGGKVRHALEQLENTIKIIAVPGNGYIEKEFTGKFAYAILSHCPISGTEIQNRKKQFRRDLDTKLVIKNRECSIPL